MRDSNEGRHSSDKNDARADLLELVLRRGYTRRDEPFRLSSGGTSRDYVDMRRAVADGNDLRLASIAVLSRLSDLGVEFGAIGGMTMGSDPVSHAIAVLTGKPWFSVRKAEKTHGAGRRIEGAELGPGIQVVCFEDTVSTGRSLLEACDVVAASGAAISLAMTMLDRGELAAAQFRARGLSYDAILNYRDLGIEPLDA